MWGVIVDVGRSLQNGFFSTKSRSVIRKNRCGFDSLFPKMCHESLSTVFTPSPILQVRLVFLVLSVVGAIPAIRPGDYMQGGAPQVDWGHRDFPEILEKNTKNLYIHLFMVHTMYHNFRILKGNCTGRDLCRFQWDRVGRASCNFSKTRQACTLCDSLGPRGGKLNIL